MKDGAVAYLEQNYMSSMVFSQTLEWNHIIICLVWYSLKPSDGTELI